MALKPIEQTTVDFYNANAADWAGAPGHNVPDGEYFWGGMLADLLKLLPEGRMLEVGSGSGRDAGFLHEAGYDYVGTDISEGLLEFARQRYPDLLFLLQSVYELDFPENEFDGFWTAATLLHVMRDRIQEALTRIAYVVKDGGYGFIAIKQGDKDDIEVDDRGQRLFVYYEDAEFRAELAAAGMEVVRFEYRPVSERTKWLMYLVRVHKQTVEA